jgi:ankyrin repeat protein
MLGIVRPPRRPYKETVRNSAGFRLLPVCLLLAFGPVAAAQTRPASVVDLLSRGDRAEALRAIDQRADVNLSQPDGTTPLHLAAEREDAPLVQKLIAAGANVTAQNRYGVAPLSVAASTGNAAVVTALLAAGADPNTAVGQGETALMAAARTGHVDAIKALLARGAAVNAHETWRNQTALMWAAVEGHPDAIDELVRAGADVKLRSIGDFTALMFAVRGGHVEAARRLLAAGADVNDAAPDGTRVLTMAIVNAHYELAALLLEQSADPNATDPRGSALHALSWMRNPGYAAAPPRTPTGNVDSLVLARSLLAKGAKPNLRVSWKEVPFDRDLGTVRSPASISIGRNWMTFIGATPFFIAAKGADLALMRLLIEHGADPNISTVQNATPLMAAAGLGFWDGESPGPESGIPESQALEAVKLCIELGNNVNAVTDYGDTLIVGEPQVLLHRHPLNLAEYADKGLGDMRWGGSTALHGAALRGADSIVQYLVEKGARVDTPNKLGWTPLIVANGVFVANTEKRWPSTVALLEDLEARSRSRASGSRAPQ